MGSELQVCLCANNDTLGVAFPSDVAVRYYSTYISRGGIAAWAAYSSDRVRRRLHAIEEVIIKHVKRTPVNAHASDAARTHARTHPPTKTQPDTDFAWSNHLQTKHAGIIGTQHEISG